MMEYDPERGQDSRGSSPGPHDEDSSGGNLQSILNELQDFRKDNRVQLTEFKQELKRVNDKMDEAEGIIGEAETVLKATSTLIKRLMQRQANLEARLINQEGQARRDNLRIYGIPEDKEGTDLPSDKDLRIEQAHRAPAPKLNGPQAKPRSIVVKFGSYQTNEVVLQRAWQKKEVSYDNTRFYVDHDFPPPEVLKKRGEYAEAKKVLKEK